MDVREFKIVRMRSKIRFAGAPTLCDSHKAERLNFAKRGRNRLAFDSVAFKVRIGDGQPSVVRATVVAELNLEAGEPIVVFGGIHSGCYELFGTERVRTIRDLKGKIIASNGQGSVSTYEVGKMLETDGLTIADVDVKVFPFNQMVIGLANKAIDAAIVIPPFTSQFLDRGFAVSLKEPDDLVKPWPLTIAVAMINTDWAKPNRDLLRNYFTAYLRGVREYCQAYHGGANRAEMIGRLIRTGTETREELLYKYPWPARDPNGRINVESMLDMQAWYKQNKFGGAQLPAERLADTSYADYAVAKLGPFVLENRDSKLAGCR